MTVKVWSERVERPGVSGWHDCTYSAILMVLVGGGKTSYPLGLYSSAEREALESSDDRPDETGATFNDTDLAIKRRYGLSVHRIPDGSKAGLTAALRNPSRVYAVAGSNSRLPSAATKWDTYTGPHAVAVTGYDKATDTVLWLDPEAPNQYAGDRVPVSQVVNWAFIPSDARYLQLGEFSGEPMIDVSKLRPVASVVFKGGSIFLNADRSQPPIGTVTAPTRFQVYGLPSTATEPGGTKASLVPCLMDLHGGPGEELALVGIGIDQMDSTTWRSIAWDDLSDDLAAAKEALRAATNDNLTLTDRIRRKDLVFDAMTDSASRLASSGKAI